MNPNNSSEASFSIVGSDFNLHEAITSKKPPGFSHAKITRELIDTDSEEDISEKFASHAADSDVADEETVPKKSSARAPSAGPSRRNLTRPKSPNPLDKPNSRIERAVEPTESDSEDSEKVNKVTIPGEYNPELYKNLEVNEEVREIFQYITKYIPQHLNLDYKFKPFVPEFIPAVGDIDAFLKIEPPETTLNNEKFDPNKFKLGLAVLDEPAAVQSEPALLHLQLRASSVNVSHVSNVVVKRVNNVEKNTKIVDKWIKDISDLHKSKSSPIVKYSDPMPDLDDLMQEWPETMENLLKLHGFPSYKFNGSLSNYIDVVCCLFDIPIYKNKIQSLYLLFSLYAVIKNSQLYRAHISEDRNITGDVSNGKVETDQLVLD